MGEKLEFVRAGYSNIVEFTVQATSERNAVVKALKLAYDYVFSERDFEYFNLDSTDLPAPIKDETEQAMEYTDNKVPREYIVGISRTGFKNQEIECKGATFADMDADGFRKAGNIDFGSDKNSQYEVHFVK